MDFVIDCWFLKFDRWPLSEVSDQMIATLERSGETNDRNAWGWIYRKLSRQKRESYKMMINIESFVSINKKWLFGFPGVHFSQSRGDILTDARKKIGDLHIAPPVELGNGYRTPEVLRGLLEKNYFLRNGGQGLTDSALIKPSGEVPS